MARTAADVLADRLIDWGVTVVFGLPGDGINGIMEALRVRQDKVSFVQVRHEESAAVMACGYAEYTGRIGVCLATSGPGAIHLLNGLYDAKLDHAPVLAITGQTYHDLTPVGGLRRRRRILDADGRVRDSRGISAADQGGDRQERRARYDQMGADGIPRQSRVWRRARADRLREIRRGVRRELSYTGGHPCFLFATAAKRDSGSSRR